MGRGVEVQLNSFLTSALNGGKGSTSRPGRFTPPWKKKTALLIEQEVVWTFWRIEKFLVPPGKRTPDSQARSVVTIWATLCQLIYVTNTLLTSDSVRLLTMGIMMPETC